MSAGDSISILASCDDDSVTYRIGIKNKETGDMTSMTGTGILIHEFKISESGTYTAFVENNLCFYRSLINHIILSKICIIGVCIWDSITLAIWHTLLRYRKLLPK